MGELRECCANERNRVVRKEDQDPERPKIEVQRCKICNRRHIIATVEPGVIGLHGSDV